MRLDYFSKKLTTFDEKNHAVKLKFSCKNLKLKSTNFLCSAFFITLIMKLLLWLTYPKYCKLFLLLQVMKSTHSMAKVSKVCPIQRQSQHLRKLNKVLSFCTLDDVQIKNGKHVFWLTIFFSCTYLLVFLKKLLILMNKIYAKFDNLITEIKMFKDRRYLFLSL